MVKVDAFPGYDNKKLLFFGHYWWTGPVQRITPKLTCLDYSIAKADESGQLVAYRWGGEDEIRDENFYWVRDGKDIRGI